MRGSRYYRVAPSLKLLPPQKNAGDLDYVMYETFAGDLQVMGGGTFINIAKDAFFFWKA
jgi:hypothetical protein